MTHGPWDDGNVDPSSASDVVAATAAELRRQRHRLGIGQVEAAERARLTRGTLSYAEWPDRRHPLTVEHFVADCIGLGVRPSDVLRAAEDEAVPPSIGGTGSIDDAGSRQ
jgi:hypothetical protein